MIDENKTAMNDTPSEPNGHANGTTTTATAEGAPKGALSSSKKKKKKKKVHQHNQKPTTAPVDTAAGTTAEQPSAEATVPVVPDASAVPIEESTAAPITDAVLIADTAAAPIVDAAVPIVDTAAAPIVASAESLRLRMKVWTDPAMTKRYLIPSAFMRDLVDGQPVSDVMYAYVMSDEDTKLILLKASEWNALPFFYFQEDGPAPRATKRPVDVILST